MKNSPKLKIRPNEKLSEMKNDKNSLKWRKIWQTKKGIELRYCKNETKNFCK